jgi:hypothetical protein
MKKYIQIFSLAVFVILLMNSCVNGEIKKLAKAAGNTMIARSYSAEDKLRAKYDSTLHDPEISLSITTNVLKLKTTSNEMCDYIDSDLYATIRLAGGENSFYKGYSSQNTSASTDYFITKGSGNKLQRKLLSYYSGLQEMAPDIASDSLKKTLIELRNPMFSQIHFHRAKMDAVNDLLNKYKDDVRNNESVCLQYILKNGRKK